MKHWYRSIHLLGALLFVLSSSLFSQVADSNLVGTITDQTGAVIANVALDLENMETGVRHQGRSDDSGQYRFNNVPVGRYKLTATAQGFTTTTVQNVQLELNRTATVNMTIAVGSVTTQVEVVESATLIDTTTGTIQTTFNSKQTSMMPISGTGTLGVINLSLLGAGVTSSGGAGYGTGPSVGGMRPTNNNFMVEGTDNNNRSVTGPVVTLSNEAVAEFSIQQNQFGTEFGHSTGGQFNTIIKSGTNEFHGSIYEYFQNRNLNAVDEQFARQGIRSNPRSDVNRLGATLGGPVLRNRLFFFGGYEYRPLGEASTAAGAVFVPTAAGIQTLENTPGIVRKNLDIFKTYVPLASTATRSVNVAGATIPTGILSITGPAFENTYSPLVSIDVHATDRDQLRLRWANNKIDSMDTVANLPEFFTPVKLAYHLASAAYFRTFSPGVTNELRFGYTRRVADRPIGSQSIAGLDVFPNFQFNDLGLIIGPNGNYPQSDRSNTFQLANNINWVIGRHALKFGYDGRKVNSTNFFVQRQRGDYIYESLDRFLRDITPEFAQRSGGGTPFIGNLLSHYAYVADEWKIRPNVTLTLGLRYEFVDVPAGAKAQSINSVASVPGLLEIGAPEPTTKDFAPRVGLAWSPGQSGRTSIRAGFGMAYDQIYQNLGTNSLPPQYFTTIDAHIEQANQPNFIANGGIRPRQVQIASAATARALTSSYIPIKQVRPYSLQWNFGVQRVFGQDYTLEVRYLGTRGVHLPFQVQLNRAAAITGTNRSLPTLLARPSQSELDGLRLTLPDITTGFNSNIFAGAGFSSTITSFTPQGNSSYHGLATELSRRFTQGFTTKVAYTWSHNIDDSTAALFSTITTPRRPQDFLNLRPERADSALDRRHRLTVGWVYDTPWMKGSDSWFVKNLVGNWLFSGAYTAETGAWATPRSGVDSNLNGDNAGDRTIINTAGQSGVGSGVTALRNSANQIVAYLADNPNARYIQAGQGVFPTAARNTLRLPGVNNFDLTLGKRFNVTERVGLEFRVEAYNALNNSQYVPGFPSAANLRSRTNAAATNMLLPNNPSFNRPDLAFQSNARKLQLVGRFTF